MGADRVELAVVGAGPTAISLLERLVANVGVEPLGCDLLVHLVDPFAAGAGRVWRPDLSPLLWMNSMAEDVTMFTDESVRLEGPVVEGPTLDAWAAAVGRDEIDAPAGLRQELRALQGNSFPTRRVQSAYLRWFLERLLGALPPGVEVVHHPTIAVDVRDAADGRQVLELADCPDPLVVDAVVLALGHLDSSPDPASAGLAEHARRHGLVHLPPGHTAELDLSALAAGEDVLVSGFGQAFTDLLVLVTEGRGGRFHPAGGGALRYEPSGREPVLHVGSRRGVPYRSKITAPRRAGRAPLPRFLDRDAVADLRRRAPLDLRADLVPVVLKEVLWARCRELAHAQPHRLAHPWAKVESALEEAATLEEVRHVGAAAVRDEADCFDIERGDRPLRGLRFPSGAAAHRHVAAHVARDVARRTDPSNGVEQAAFDALLTSFAALAQLGPALTPRSRVDDLGTWWYSFFMYWASGPPPERLRQLLALADAGLVRFLGANVAVRADGAGTFVASSSSHPDETSARSLVEARIATPSLARTADTLLGRLRDRGEAVEEVVADGDWARTTGRVLVEGPGMRLVGRGGPHPRRRALGGFTSRPAAGAFARPGTNAPSFRQNDAVAREILADLAARVAPGAARVAP